MLGMNANTNSILDRLLGCSLEVDFMDYAAGVDFCNFRFSVVGSDLFYSVLEIKLFSLCCKFSLASVNVFFPPFVIYIIVLKVDVMCNVIVKSHARREKNQKIKRNL